MSTAEQQEPSPPAAGDVSIRPMQLGDLQAADRVMRMAFGTFLGAPDPMLVFGDAEYVRPRFTAEPRWAFAAELDGDVVGSNFATRWGSFGFFGPLTVRVDLWDQGIAKRLMEPIMDLFERWQVRQAGLFTFPNSPKHIGLYQKFGFWPQHLTPLMEKAIAPTTAGGNEHSTYAEASEGERRAILSTCRSVTDAIFEGLDVEYEIRATDAQELGDTVLVQDGSELAGFAVCHCGAGEAGSGQRRPPRRLPHAARAGLPHLARGRDHAKAERAGIQPTGRLRDRRPPLTPRGRPPRRGTALPLVRTNQTRSRAHRLRRCTRRCRHSSD
jgi:GNAT superfamily N-acetyltransferase